MCNFELQEANFGLKEIIVQLAIVTACAKGAEAIGGLMEALEASGNTQVISALGTWVREDFATAANGVVRLAGQQTEEEPVRPDFFEQAAPSHELTKVANFINQAGASMKGTLSLEFDRNRMIAHLADNTVKLWNWIDKEEKTTKLGDKVTLKPSEVITSFQYDDEILVVGTSVGTIYLFDTRTHEEKWSVRLGEPIIFLKFVESVIVIRTRGWSNNINVEQFWWVQVSRSDMQLLSPRLMLKQDYGDCPKFLVDPLHIFLYHSGSVNMYDTKSGGCVSVPPAQGYGQASFASPANINTLNLIDLTSHKRVLVAGYKNGVVAMWHTNYLSLNQQPFKTFQGHTKAILSLCPINEHLVSVDKSGKLLMWSGYDLQNGNIKQPIPRILAENFHNVTCLVGCERWLASSSSKDGIINIWALPDSWYRAG